VGDLPSHGTCLAGESQRIAPMPSPSDGETQSETVVEIEEKNA
jgi:hypothetical protein